MAVLTQQQHQKTKNTDLQQEISGWDKYVWPGFYGEPCVLTFRSTSALMHHVQQCQQHITTGMPGCWSSKHLRVLFGQEVEGRQIVRIYLSKSVAWLSWHHVPTPGDKKAVKFDSAFRSQLLLPGTGHVTRRGLDFETRAAGILISQICEPCKIYTEKNLSNLYF